MEWTTAIPSARRSAGRLDGAAVAVAVVVLLTLTALVTPLISRPAGPTAIRPARTLPPAASLSGLRSLPLGAQAVISDTLASRDPAFRIRPLAGQPGVGSVSAGGLQARFSHGAVELSARGAQLRLAPSSVGWYRAGPLGIEQAFTIAHARGTRASTVTLAISGDVSARLSNGVVSFSRGGRVAFRYGGLSASDSAHHALRSWFTVTSGAVVIHVSTQGARFPIHIDPFVQAAEFPSQSPTSGFGDSVAANNSTILIGAPGQTVNGIADEGAAYVFSEPPGGWSSSTTAVELDEPSGATKDYFGISVALADGIAVVGANGADGGHGAAYVFTRPSTGGWLSGTIAAPAELTASDGASGDGFGFIVATDGSTVAVGSGTPSSGPVVYVFTTSGTWTSQSGNTELAITGSTSTLTGNSIAVSGNTVFAGAYSTSSQNPGAGAVYVFTNWAASQTTDQAATITDPDSGTDDRFGWALAVDGSELAVGAPYDAGFGKVYVWNEPVGGWTDALTAPAVLTDPSGNNGQELGDAVAIDSTAQPQVVVASAPGATVDSVGDQGVLDVFTEPSDGWAGSITPSAQLTAPDGAEYDQLGGEVNPKGDLIGSGALAIDGGTVVAGSAYHANKTGAAYVFTATTTSTAITTTTAGTTTTTQTTTTGTSTSTSTTTTTGTTTTPVANPRATVTAVKPNVTGVTDKITCHGASGQKCAVTEQLTITEHISARGKLTGVSFAKKRNPKPKLKAVVVAKKSISVAAGKTVSVKLVLDGAAKRLLKSRKRLPIRLTAVLIFGREKQTFATRNVTLKSAKPRKQTTGGKSRA